MTSSTPDALWASRSARAMRPAAVVCRSVSRSVGRRKLLDRVDLVVPVGARLLLVSDPPESASLLLRVLAGLTRPSSGVVRLAGLRRADDSAAGWARRVGYVGPEVGLWSWISPAEVLELATRLAGYPAAERKTHVDLAAERFKLAGALHGPLGRGGPALVQRTALAAAMLTDPEVVLLDEPLRAIDPGERARLLKLPGRRRTLLIASRYPASETGIVDQVALLRDGRTVLHAPITELESRGLPLSMAGIEALREHREAERGGGTLAG